MDRLQMARTGPVVVGGLGGSGTRVIAAALREAGFYLGADLNESLDNLWFTVLFKRRRWLVRQIGRDGDAIPRLLRLFEKAMTSEDPLSLTERLRAAAAAVPMVWQGHDWLRRGRGAWPLMRLRSLKQAHRVPRAAYRGWGWKEPNSHVLLPWLVRSFPAMKYIHTLRHGLDMAYSANQAQLHNWAGLYDVPVPPGPNSAPSAALDYWIAANTTAIRRGRDLLGGRFLLVRYDAFCERPEEEAARLLSFLGGEPSAAAVGAVARHCTPPASLGRHRRHDGSSFTRAQIDAVARLGFDVKAA